MTEGLQHLPATLSALARRAAERLAPIGRRLADLPRRPWFAVALILLCSLAALSEVTTTPLAADPDTPDLLKEIRKELTVSGVLGWSVHDWPLRNHFYRPVPAWSLALDSAVYGDWAPGYRITNLVLATAAALMVYWWIALWTRRSELGLVAGLIFQFRQADMPAILPYPAAPLAAVAALLLMACLVRTTEAERRRRAGIVVRLAVVPAAVVALSLEWQANAPIIAWIATRTAILGGLFSVACAAACTAYIHTGRRAPLLATLVLAALALGSYEQSVMVVAFPLASLLAVRGASVRRAVGATLALVGTDAAYAVVRYLAVGASASGYQMLQAKSSQWGGPMELLRYTFAPYCLVPQIVLRTSTSGLLAVMDEATWGMLAELATWVFAYARALRVAARPTLALWAMKALLLLPMSFLHPFAHYYYLPEAAAAGLAACLIFPELLRSPDAPAAPQPEQLPGEPPAGDREPALA